MSQLDITYFLRHRTARGQTRVLSSGRSFPANSADMPVAGALVAVPESAVPESAVPESAVPESAVPESAVPESAVPESAVPESAVPVSSVAHTTHGRSSPRGVSWHVCLPCSRLRCAGVRRG